MENVFGIKRKQLGVGEITLPLTMSKAIHALTKMELDQIRQYYRFPNTSNLKKQQLAEVIIADLPSRMVEGLSSLNQELFELVQRIIELGGIWQVDEFPLDKALHLMKIGLVFPGLYQGKNVLVVPKEQMEIFRFFVVGESGPKYKQIKMQFSNVINFPQQENMNQQRDLIINDFLGYLVENHSRKLISIWNEIGYNDTEDNFADLLLNNDFQRLIQAYGFQRGGNKSEGVFRHFLSLRRHSYSPKAVKLALAFEDTYYTFCRVERVSGQLMVFYDLIVSGEKYITQYQNGMDELVGKEIICRLSADKDQWEILDLDMSFPGSEYIIDEFKEFMASMSLQERKSYLIDKSLDFFIEYMKISGRT